MLERGIVITIAFVLDFLFGDPQGMWHPVIGIGKLISGTEELLRRIFNISEERNKDKIKKRVAGMLLSIIVIAVSVGICFLILMLADKINHILRLAVESFMCYQMLAMKSLRDESMKVYAALMTEDIEASRKAVSMIVGRDTDKLDEKGVTKAAVETVAENTSDGIIAPLLFMLLLGAPGAYFYKAINTMDSMIGYKNDRYVYFGTVAARLDDVVNFIPARLSAILMIIAAYILPDMDGANALRIFKRDRLNHTSPNSAQTEACCAGALDIKLAGDAYYFGKLHRKLTIGDAIREIEIEDIKRANRLMYATSFAMLVFGLLVIDILIMFT